MEGQFEGQNPAMVTQESKTEGEMLSESKNHFQAILQLLQLIDALLPEDEHKNHSCKLNHGTRDNRKSFDFFDSITNLMVRNDEVVVAVACGGLYPTHGLILVDSVEIWCVSNMTWLEWSVSASVYKDKRCTDGGVDCWVWYTASQGFIVMYK